MLQYGQESNNRSNAFNFARHICKDVQYEYADDEDLETLKSKKLVADDFM